MSRHFSPEEFVDAIDGVLAASRRAHLDECEACRQEAGSLATLARQVDGAADVPEPSPLFWDHLSRRVREATAIEAAPAFGWWRIGWRPLLAGGAMVAAAALVVVLRAPQPVEEQTPGPATLATNASSGEIGAIDPVIDGDAAWDLVVAMAGELSVDAVHDVLSSGPETAVLPETMTPRERQEFVKLLKQEMGGLE